MNLKEIIDEIRRMKVPNHRNSLDIFNLLQNNQKLFVQKIDTDVLKLHLRNFELLSEKHPKEYNAGSYKDEFERAYNSLLFYLDKIF